MSKFLKDAADKLLPYKTSAAVVKYIRRYDYLYGMPPFKAPSR